MERNTAVWSVIEAEWSTNDRWLVLTIKRRCD